MDNNAFEWNEINLRGRSRGLLKTICPKCSHTRKNKKDPCLSVDVNKKVAKCHNCGATSFEKTNDNPINYKNQLQEPVKYTTPKKPNITALSERGLKMFEDRAIPQEVLKANKIAVTKDGKGVVFPYFRDGELVNYKTRMLDKKDFRQAVGAEPMMYNYDRIKNAKEIIINEGEFDSLSWEVAGIEHHTSVNQGAPNVNDENVDKKLECLTNCYDAFEQAEVVYIGVDNDANGRRLEEELIRRIGVEKVKVIDYSPFKDANQYLIEKGAFELKKLLETAVEPKVEGIFKAEDKWEAMKDTFHNGKDRGTTTYFPSIDEGWTWRQGEVNVWTGYENEGKSTLLEQLAVIKSAYEGWKWAIFSPENTPIADFYDNLIEMFIGKSADPFYKSNQMSFEEYQEAYEFVNEHFFVIYPEEDFKLETVFNKAKYLVRKYGIKGIIIDPYNSMEHLQKSAEREELYIARFMGKLKRFATDYSLSMNLVAHQNTQRKNDKDEGRYFKPMKSNIKGGGVFAQRADNVLIVWRPEMALNFSDPSVVWASQKIKKQKLVGIPSEVDGIVFSRKTNRYYIGGKNPLEEIDRKRLGDSYEETPAEHIPVAFPNEAFGDIVEPITDVGGDDWASNNDDVPF